MKTIIWVIVALAVIGIGSYLFTNSFAIAPNVDQNTDGTAVDTSDENETPAFEWSYSSLGDDANGIPQTSVMLTMLYPNGGTETKEIEKIEGSCNTYADEDSDTYIHSQMIMCYYAGFGRYYKVVKTNDGYDVLRREFEEATPDYNPPVASYEVVAQF